MALMKPSNLEPLIAGYAGVETLHVNVSALCQVTCAWYTLLIPLPQMAIHTQGPFRAVDTGVAGSTRADTTMYLHHSHDGEHLIALKATFY